MEVVGTLQLLWFCAGVVMKMHSKFWTAIDKMPALPMPKNAALLKEIYTQNMYSGVVAHAFIRILSCLI